MSYLHNIHLIVLSSVLVLTDGHFYAVFKECTSSFEDGRDMVYISTYTFNQMKITQFNSTVGKYVGYTAYGVKNAEAWNNQPGELDRQRAEVDRVCRSNNKIYYEGIFNRAVNPEIEVKLMKKAEGSHPAVLMCSAYNFYPPNIKVTWLRNSKEFKGGITSTEEMPDGDWYYQVHSHLEYTPQSGEEISCVVQHASSTKPYIYKWENSASEANKSKIAIGASGLVLGIILSAAGFIYYKKKSHGRILVPT